MNQDCIRAFTKRGRYTCAHKYNYKMVMHYIRKKINNNNNVSWMCVAEILELANEAFVYWFEPT